jgi:TolA-binding protein
MEKTLETTVDLAEKTMDEKDAVKKEEKMQDDSSRLDALEEQLNQLRVDIAQIFEAMKGKKAEDMAVETKDEEEARKKLEEKDEMQGMPNSGGPSKTNMSAAKKFTGAPVEETTNLSGLFKSKKEGTMLGSVLAKMSNSRF